MLAFTGIVELIAVSNPYTRGQAEEERSPIPLLQEGNIKLVHYPDCQQLILWLPAPGRDYGNFRLVSSDNNEILEAFPVADQLSGSIQLIRDTLPWTPGNYRIEIDHPGGWQHQVLLKKYEYGDAPPQPLPEEKIPDTETEPIVYRDGLGNIIENEDLLLREKALRDISRRFRRRITFKGNFRAGSILFTDGDRQLEFYHEMGGGNCLFYVDIPSAADWEKQTGITLAEREDIIRWLAATVHTQQAPSARYEIGDTSIVYYKK